MPSYRQFLLAIGFSFSVILPLTAWYVILGKNRNIQEMSPEKRTGEDRIDRARTKKDDDEDSLKKISTSSPLGKLDNKSDKNRREKGRSFQSVESLLKSKREPGNALFGENDDSDCLALCKPMTAALGDARMNDAREMALLVQNQNPECEKNIAEEYKSFVDPLLRKVFVSGPPQAMKIPGFHDQYENSVIVPQPSKDDAPCWNPLGDTDANLEDASAIVIDRWDQCCSQISKRRGANSIVSGSDDAISSEKNGKCYRFDRETQQRHHVCCGLSPGTLSHLRLPFLQELAVSVRLETSDADEYDIVVQQDGFLRQFDPAAVLWPTGYLLSMCLANPERCGIPELNEAVRTHEGRVVSVELGAGVGLPSIVLGLILKKERLFKETEVLATDRALHALYLTLLNSQAAGVSLMVAHIEDHTNVTQLIEMKSNTHAIGSHSTYDKGYSIVLGSSLQALFDHKTRDPRHKLWAVLDELLDKKNPNAIALLAHVVGSVTPPSPPEDSLFERVRSISGNQFGMMTRSGDDSDFEISVYRRIHRSGVQAEL